MSRSSAESKYWEALERILNGQTQVVDLNQPGFRITNLIVALEAGKANPKGYIRPQRYPELCDAIRAADTHRRESPQSSKTRRPRSEVEKRQVMNVRYKELRDDYEKLLEQYLNVVKENFELKTQMASNRDPKKTTALHR